jgi:hypothetical protein
MTLSLQRSPSQDKAAPRAVRGPLPFAWSAGRRLAFALGVIALLWLAVGWANGWFVPALAVTGPA